MKILLPTLLLLACLLLPARAQTPGGGSTADSEPLTANTPPAPSRNIMPLQLNHKPNAVNPPPEISGPIDKFFKTLKTGDYAAAYEAFLAGSRLGAQKEKMSVFVSKTQEAFGIYGKLNDDEVFDNYSVGSNVLVLTYLSRHDLQPLRWRFIFYRADKQWTLINMGFDDVLLDMLD